MSAVTWGKRQRYRFVACGSLSTWMPPIVPGVYAITYKQDPLNKPKSHTVLYFGECEDLSQEAAALNQRVVRYWLGGGGVVEDLYVFVYPMSGLNSRERTLVLERLIADYQPYANNV